MSADAKRLEFEVVSFTSEDVEGPASQLNDSTPAAQGWKSPPFPDFPQDIVIRLYAGVSRIRSLQILLHEFMVPSRLEFYVGQGNQDSHPSSVNFQFLGYVSCSASKAPKQVRELKTVQADALGNFIKLRVSGVHEHIKNLCNQVGIVAVCVMGAIHIPKQPENNQNEPIDVTLLRMGVDMREFTSSDEPGIDPWAQNLIRDLKAMRHKCNQREDFEIAEHITSNLHCIIKFGKQMQDAADQKAKSVLREDYASAKAMKSRYEELRQLCLNHFNEATSIRLPPKVLDLPVSPERLRVHEPQVVEGASTEDPFAISRPSSESAAKDDGMENISGHENGELTDLDSGHEARASATPPCSEHAAIEDPFARSRSAMLSPSGQDTSDSTPLPKIQETLTSPQDRQREALEATLKDADDFKISEEIQDLVGVEGATKIFSGNRIDLETGLFDLACKLSDGRSSGDEASKRKGIHAALSLIARHSSQKVPSVVFEALNLLFCSLESAGQTVGSELLKFHSNLLQKIVSNLVTKCHDANTRVRRSCFSCLLFMSTHIYVGPRLILDEFFGVSSLTSMSAKIAQYRLFSLWKLLDEFGIDEPAGLSLGRCGDLLGTCLNHASAGVRGAATELVGYIYKAFSSESIISALGDIPTNMKASINVILDKIDNAGHDPFSAQDILDLSKLFPEEADMWIVISGGGWKDKRETFKPQASEEEAN